MRVTSLLKQLLIATTIVCIFTGGLIVSGEPVTTHPVRRGYDMRGYMLFGGQNGTWFENGQYAKLSKVSLENLATEKLEPYDSDGQGTVWSGGWNGTQWLVAGWGTDAGVNGSNPYLYLYDDQRQVLAGSTEQFKAESTWRGGDVFCVSYNGHEWLLSGLGSGHLPRYGNGNHMSLATFNGTTFTDYSSIVPHQQDYILYANAWNGKYWLVGGGYGSDGILFSFNGSATRDLTKQIRSAVPSFGAVQAIAWNGTTWLIGGSYFLANFDGTRFDDLTSSLVGPLGISDFSLSVNSIAWGPSAWVIGGGPTRARTNSQPAWLAEYGAKGVRKIQLPAPLNGEASILSVAVTGNLIVAGGYANSHGAVVTYWNGEVDDMSYLIENDMSYVNWVAVRD